MKQAELTSFVSRNADGIACECGGYADRDFKMTAKELHGRTCGRDSEDYQCCARAFVCRICKTRLLGSASAPECD